VNRREWLLGSSALLAFPAWGAARAPLLLLYPDTQEPERSLYRLIHEGIDSVTRSAGLTLVEAAVGANLNVDSLTALIVSSTPRAAIALGRPALNLAREAPLNLPLYVGAVELETTDSGPYGGISLIVDPRRVFATLRELAPAIRRVLYVSDPHRFDWLRAGVERAAVAAGLQAVPYEASSLSEAAAHYLNIFRYANPATDALWLLEQGQFVTADTLPRIVEESWARQFIVFSNVLDHVNKGVLFAHYPDPRSLGERLARLALEDGLSAHQVLFDEAPRRAVNLRVARHLAGTVDVTRLPRFDLTVGEP
jgi:putative ABC transport system substrate-binding protein